MQALNALRLTAPPTFLYTCLIYRCMWGGGGLRSSAVHRQIAPVFSHWITLHDVCAGRLATTRLMIYSLQCINNAQSFLKSYVNTLAGAAREGCEFSLAVCSTTTDQLVKNYWTSSCMTLILIFG